MVKRFLLVLTNYALLCSGSTAQQDLLPEQNGVLRIYEWRDHLPYGRTIDVCLGEGMTYAATPFSVFSVNKTDKQVKRINKVNLLADVGISAIEYDFDHHLLVVGYENGNLDLVMGETAYNLADIKRSSIVGDKKIYKIVPHGDLIYLATGLGVVVIDPVKEEVRGTYFIGDNGDPLRINDLDIYQDTLFATTPLGVRKAALNNPFLANYTSWTEYEDMPHIFDEPMALEFFGGTSFAIYRDAEGIRQLYERDAESGIWSSIPQAFASINVNELNARNGRLCIATSFGLKVLDENLDPVLDEMWHIDDAINSEAAIADADGNTWFANSRYGLCVNTTINEDLSFQPSGPDNARVRRIDSYNDHLWIAHGGVDGSYTNTYHVDPISSLDNEKWFETANVDDNNTEDMLWDMMDVAIDPLDNNHQFLGSWEGGLVEVSNHVITNIYTNTNSTLEASGFSFFPDWVGVAGVAFDNDGNLWCTNSWTSKGLHVRERNGTFHAFDLAPYVTATDKVTDVMCARQGYQWAIVSGKGLLVLNTNGTLGTEGDNNIRLLKEGEGSGGLPSNDVYCMEEDLDNEVWVGTLQGIAVYYNPECLFTDEPCDAEQILIEQDGNVQILLETEAVTCIEIDGGNRKWVGTQNSGVFLFSPDGLDQIYHFTEENSPLLSNNVSDIAINHSTGEVFFATEKGIVSMLSDATNFDNEITAVRVFPNPVQAGFSGVIAIDGLAFDSDVKITDISGNLVYSTTSEGGRAIWDGNTLTGETAANGVYLIFAAGADGSATQVGKVAVVR